jgi:hypothetical protein
MIMDRLHTDLRITTLLALANVIATGSSASCSAKPSRATDVLATKATARPPRPPAEPPRPQPGL